MAQASKTFAGSTLTPTGDAAVSGNALTVAAAASYLDDFESYGIGATPTGMTTVAATATVASSSGQKVMRVVAASWGGVYYTGATFADGCFVATALAVAARMNTVARHNASAARGYPMQLLASFVQMGDSIPTNFVSLNSPLRIQQDGITMPAVPWTTKIQTFTEAGSNVQVRMWLNDVLRFDYLDSIRKWPAGNLAAQAFVGTTDYSAWAFYPVKTGGFTATLTPNSVTSLTRIVIEWDSENSVPKRTSEVFEYQIDGGAWTALPDSGYINAACTATIGIRANSTLKNGYDSTGAVSVNSIAVEIDGQWDAYVPPAVNAPTGLAAGTPTSSSVPLTWTDAASPAAFVDVYVATSELGSYSLAEVATQGDQAVTVYGLSPATAYWFKLKARSTEGATSSFTAAVTATTAASTMPAQPTGLTATADGARRIDLTWLDGADTDALIVYRNTANNYATATAIASVVAGTQAYTDTEREPSTEYFYWVLPIGTNGAGPVSAVASATTAAVPSLTLSVADDLSYDLLVWIVATALGADSEPLFTNGELATEALVAGTFHALLDFSDDAPADALVVTAAQDDETEPGVPVRVARVECLIRAQEDEAIGSARNRAQACAKAIAEHLRDADQRNKAMQTLPSGRVVHAFTEISYTPAGQDVSGRFEYLLEFTVRYMDTLTQTN